VVTNRGIGAQFASKEWNPASIDRQRNLFCCKKNNRWNGFGGISYILEIWSAIVIIAAVGTGRLC
jgi:hypothetical protein